jgi:hypothetical protein
MAIAEYRFDDYMAQFVRESYQILPQFTASIDFVPTIQRIQMEGSTLYLDYDTPVGMPVKQFIKEHIDTEDWDTFFTMFYLIEYRWKYIIHAAAQPYRKEKKYILYQRDMWTHAIIDKDMKIWLNNPEYFMLGVPAMHLKMSQFYGGTQMLMDFINRSTAEEKENEISRLRQRIDELGDQSIKKSVIRDILGDGQYRFYFDSAG